MTVIIVSEWQMDSSAVDGIPRVAPAGFGAIVMEGSNTGIMEGRNPGRWMFDNDNPSAGFKLSVLVDKDGWFEFKKMVQLPAPDQASRDVVQALADRDADKAGRPIMDGGPDALTIRTNDPIYVEVMAGPGGKPIPGMTSKMEQHFQTIFYPDPEKPIVHCHINGHDVSLSLGGIQSGSWDQIAADINARNKTAGFVPVGAAEPTQAITLIKTSWSDIKTPGALWDTPRRAAETDQLEMIPQWHRMTAFTRSVLMAMVTLTDIRSRSSILGMQRVGVDDIAHLVYCRGDEDAAPAHRQQREDIFRAFEALRAGAVPILTIGWKPIKGRRTRWVKEYHLVVGSFVQSYGVVARHRTSGEIVTSNDPLYRRVAVRPTKEARQKKTKDLVRESPDAAYLKAFPADKYKLVAFLFQWNTSVAEDLICPQVALDEEDYPRLKLKSGRHHAGNRFVKISRDYFQVQKSFRDAGLTYAPRLHDFIISEFNKTMRLVNGAVLVEIAADKVIKYVDAWDRYQDHRKEVIDDVMKPAIEALISEGVLLSGSWVQPRNDRNPDRRKAPFYRWRIAEKWTAYQMVPKEEVDAVEDAIVAAAEDEDADQLAPLAGHPVKVQADQPHLPGMDAPPADSTLTADAIKSARIAAGMTLRGWQKAVADGLPAGVKAPSHFTWHMIEGGQRGDLTFRRMAPEVVAKVKELVARNRPEGSS